MFFSLHGLKPEEAEIVFQTYNKLLKESREKEERKRKKEENEKKRNEIYAMMAKNPTTSFTGMLAYGNLLSQLNE